MFRGNVLRLPAKYPYEERVDFIIFETRFDERRYGLMVSSGYKAGIPLVYLPRGLHRILLFFPQGIISGKFQL
ncbi:Imm45 family immunity protein [Agrobacterium cavarae]|uniref:Imm45 family immunity protein n=1 Tax=Agrobacterium TaxID=357 RepID=UPI003CCFF037